MIVDDGHRGRSLQRRLPTSLTGGHAWLLVTWLCTVAFTLAATHIPIHLRVSEQGKDFAFFVWAASLLGCVLIVATNWIVSRNRAVRSDVLSMTKSSLKSEVVISAVLRAAHEWAFVFFLTSDKFTASFFPVANAVAFGLTPVLICWFGSLVRPSAYIHNSVLHQLTAVCLSICLLYASSGLYKTGFYVTDLATACLASTLAAGSRVSASLAMENNSTPRLVFLRLLALVVTFPVLILATGRLAGARYWMQYMWRSPKSLAILAAALPLSDYFMLQLQAASFTPISSAITDTVAWILSFVILTFLDRIELLSSALFGALLALPTFALHIFAVLSYIPPSDSTAVS